MKRLSWLLLGCMVLAGCWSAGPPPNPPEGSYRGMEFSVNVKGALEHVKGAAVTAAFFNGGAVRPVLGRTFLRDENGSGRVAVISYRFWNDKFHGDPSAIGSTVQVSGNNMTIVGVMPNGFEIPDGAQLWVAWLPR